MKFTVSWSAAAEDDLAQFWLSTAQRDRLTRAVSELDDELSREPRGAASWNTEGLWFRDAGRLRAAYVIDDTDRCIEVVGIGLLAKE